MSPGRVSSWPSSRSMWWGTSPASSPSGARAEDRSRRSITTSTTSRTATLSLSPSSASGRSRAAASNGRCSRCPSIFLAIVASSGMFSSPRRRRSCPAHEPEPYSGEPLGRIRRDRRGRWRGWRGLRARAHPRARSARPRGRPPHGPRQHQPRREPAAAGHAPPRRVGRARPGACRGSADGGADAVPPPSRRAPPRRAARAARCDGPVPRPAPPRDRARLRRGGRGHVAGGDALRPARHAHRRGWRARARHRSRYAAWRRGGDPRAPRRGRRRRRLHLYKLWRGHAPRYAARGAVLLGDAIHVINPVMAQGMTMAIEDAAALAHHVGPALACGAVNEDLDGLFAAYERERRPINAGVIRWSHWMRWGFALGGPGVDVLHRRVFGLANSPLGRVAQRMVWSRFATSPT